MKIKHKRSKLSFDELIEKCGSPKILLVDDKDENIKFLGTLLKTLNWLKLFVALGGQNALKATMEYRPDLILLDLNMADMDGIETLKRLRDLGALEFSTVIFLTASQDQKSRLEGLSLGCADYIHKPFDQEELLFKVSYHVKMRLYEKALIKNLEDTEALLDNMNQSVFFIGEKGIIIPPVSSYSEKIFGENIEGKNVSDFLFYNLRKGTKKYGDLSTVFSIIFGSNELQFFGLEDNLPKIVTLPDQKNKKGKTLKLSYSGFFDKDKLLEKLMCIVEDVTTSEEHLKKAEEDQESYQFISEIMKVEDKETLAKKLEDSIQTMFTTLEDFVSPLSDTYPSEHFQKKLSSVINNFQDDFKHLKLLYSKLSDKFRGLEKFENVEKYKLQISAQVEASSMTCDILEVLLRYSKCVDRFIPVKLKFNLSFTDIIFEKVKDIQKIFNNLLEYAFLIKDVHNIDKEKLHKVVQLARLYPDFDRTIDLIQQRSRLLSFLFKGLEEEELSKSFHDLSSKVKKIPERSRLTEFIIENSLIEPYKEILHKTEKMETDLLKRVKKRQKDFLDEEGYFFLLIDLTKRFIAESKGVRDQTLPELPELDHITLGNLKSFLTVINQSIEAFSKKKENKDNFIKKTTYDLEALIRRILRKELEKAKALPVEKKNKKFIKFVKNYLPKK